MDKYVTTHSCEISDVEEYIQKLDAIKKLVEGNPAPPISFHDINGDEIALYDINAPLIQLFFWSTDCSHCHKIMSEMVDLYTSAHPKGLEIYAIALDIDKKVWVDAVQSNGSKWINVSDLKGFDSEVLLSYHIWSTPSYYLLDAQKKILSRPLTVYQIREDLDKYLE